MKSFYKDDYVLTEVGLLYFDKIEKLLVPLLDEANEKDYNLYEFCQLVQNAISTHVARLIIKKGLNEYREKINNGEIK